MQLQYYYTVSDMRLYYVHNSGRISLSSCLDAIIIHLSANLELNGRSSVGNSGTCLMWLVSSLS